jgi:gamma-glutamyltranspeptidase/glutathione hydrolase
MVCTSQPLATLAGLDVLRAGGNAADAAIAANAMLGLVEPMSCGIGGDLYVIYWDAKTQKLYGLNASGRSPYALNRDVFRQAGLDQIPTEGPLSWSVSGCVSGWEALRGRFGTLPFERLLAPAIEHAEEGFPVSEIIAGSWRGAEPSLARFPDSAATYLPGGHAPREGELFRNPRLAASLRAIASDGADAFYRGSIAGRIAAFSQANGGYLATRDFADHTSDWVDPVSTNYRGYDIWELPPNGQGIAALQMLNLLEPYDVG